jgi:RHS repeat-associated protein
LEGAGGIGGLLARTDQQSTTTGYPSPYTTYYHSDGNGNITCLINANQIIVAHYLYDPYGSLLSQTGPMADANLYRFSSKEFHVASGLVYYLYRFYDPNLQRWLNRDPFGEFGFESIRSTDLPLWKRIFYPGDLFLEINRYKFVDNSPVDQMDYLGLTTRPPNPNPDPNPDPNPNPSSCGDFTNKTCTDACKSIYGTNNKMLQACITVCKTVGGKSCRSLFAYCEHLMRHGAGNPAKACMTVYDELCLGE